MSAWDVALLIFFALLLLAFIAGVCFAIVWFWPLSLTGVIGGLVTFILLELKMWLRRR